MDLSNSDKIAQKSLDIISVAIALTYKWQKQDLINMLESWIKKYSESLSESEKQEYTDVLRKLDLIK